MSTPLRTACNMTQVQKKTTTMSLTISSCSRESSSSTTFQQRHSSLVQPLCISPQRTQSPSYSQQFAGNGGVAPTFIKCLHDISTVKGQLVVLECRIRGTPPLHVMWYREEELIVDSADFRILRKKASSVSVPEEVCTLVITEAFPEDSGMFKCVASNQFGTVSCSALLEVYSGLDEVLALEETSCFPAAPGPEDFPAFMCDTAEIPPPEWPESPEDEDGPVFESPMERSPEVQQHRDIFPGERQHPVPVESSRRAWSRDSSEASAVLPLVEEKPLSSKLTARRSEPSGQPDPTGTMSITNLPSFSPTAYPPSAFNYERPRHFIQSQPRFQAPSYEQACQGQSVYPNGQKPSPSSSTLSSPVSTPSSSLGSPRDPPAPRPTSPSRTPMRSSVTLVPKVPAGQPRSPAAFLSSVLPCQPVSQAKPASVAPPRPASPVYSPRTPTPPSISPMVPKTTPVPQHPAPPAPPKLPPSYRQSPASEKPIFKKSPRQTIHSTDEEIQGSKDALIQDLENKLRCKEARRRNGSQKLTYEERMARRLLGPDNVASVFDIENSQDSHSGQNSPDGKHTGTGQLRQDSGTQDSETAAIQEKCYAPRFIQVPQDLTVEEGRFCRIDFKVGGLPTPDVVWYLNGKPIRPDDYHKMLVCEKGVHSFIIEIVTVHHAGVYECVARNRAGESCFSLRLDVIAQELLRPPVFLQKMQNSRALEGDTVRLECRVSASPLPQLYWKKDKDMLCMEPDRMSLYEDNSGRICLLIERVQKADAGWYTVSAINEAGMSTCNARLDVGTRLNKAVPAGKHLKVRPTFSQYSVLNGQGADERQSRSPEGTMQNAPLYESDEL
ncbi:MYOTI protein, partial [Amia calva]|nr:MYOTI protein [Amia calva]